VRKFLNLDEYQREAAYTLPRAVYSYVAHGTETETTLRGNCSAFDAWRLVTRVLAGVSDRHQDIELFGRRYASPFGIAPMGGSGLVAYQGHTVIARAAAAANIRSCPLR
jgi:L-lactate dehydrogenase (cytochrome)